MASASGRTRAIRTRRIIGANVKNRSGMEIGGIEDVILDKAGYRILFAVVAFRGFLGMSEKHHAIPWTALDYDNEEGTYVVMYTREQLKAVPAGSIEELTRDDGVALRERAYSQSRNSLS